MSNTTSQELPEASQVAGNQSPTEKGLAQDLKTHEAQPAKTKELELLLHHAEKATGQETIALNKIITEKSK